jgi:hypothetical protein
MIIHGHPDILLGPQGLSGLHGFGSTPIPVQSDAFTRFLPENGGKGIDALYKEIRDFINTPGLTQAEIDQAAAASGVSYFDINEAFAQVNTSVYVPNPADTQPKPNEIYIYAPPAPVSTVPPPGHKVLQFDDSGYLPGRTPQPKPTAQEIRDFVSTKSQAEIQTAMAQTGITQADINYAFAQVDAGAATGQSPAYTRYLNSLPASGGAGFDPFYTEILAYQNSHTHDELLAQMVRLGI